MNDKCDGNNMKLSKGGNGFITTRMPHVTINDDQSTVHSTCWQVVPMSVVVMNGNTACCFNADTLCSTVHSVCPCLVLISSTDFGLFNAKPMYKHKSNKNLQHSFLQIVSSFLNTVPHLTHTVKLMPCCVYSCTQQDFNSFPHVEGFHLTLPHTLWIQTFCMKLVHTELCIASCCNCSLEVQTDYTAKKTLLSQQIVLGNKEIWMTGCSLGGKHHNLDDLYILLSNGTERVKITNDYCRKHCAL